MSGIVARTFFLTAVFLLGPLAVLSADNVETESYGSVRTKVYPERGVYFATHFGNWYENASDADVEQYIADLASWGCNCIGVWFDMHDFTGMDDPAAARRLARLKLIFGTAGKHGLGRDLLFLANESFKDSPPELRASWMPGANGYEHELAGHYHVELCPSRPSAVERLLAMRVQVLDAFKDAPPTSVTIFPYDQGGCTCDACAPWGANAYLALAEKLAALIRARYPGVRINLSTWRFDHFGKLGEWDGLKRQTATVRDFADRIYVDPVDLGKAAAANVLPYFAMSEISMRGMDPWGGFGANPMPHYVVSQLQTYPDVEGLRPYSEGRFEDLNKVVALAMLSGRARDADDAVGQYADCYFGPSTRVAVVEAVNMLECNHGRNAIDATRAARALSLLNAAEKTMSAEACASWRWRYLKVRAEIDVALAQGGRCDVLGRLFREVEKLSCVRENTEPYVRPAPVDRR